MVKFSYIILLITFATYSVNLTLCQQNVNEFLGLLESLGIDSLILIDFLTSLGLSTLDIEDILNMANNFDINQACEEYKNSIREDPCTKQINVICQDNPALWEMIDAGSKFPYSGMLVATKLDLGNYGECVKVDVTKNGTRVIGKYCTAGIIIPTTNISDPNFVEEAYKLSICIPNKCSAKDIIAFLNLSQEIKPLFNDQFCSTKDDWKNFGIGTIIFILCLVVVVTALIISTVYDVYMYYMKRENNNIVYKMFSMFSNGKKIFDVSKKSSDEIRVIHGLKAISMMWISIGHSFIIFQSLPNTDRTVPEEFEWSWQSAYLTPAYLAVDTFFFLSGLLLAYHYLKEEQKPLKVHVKRIPFLYFHRYVRITPALIPGYFLTFTLLPNLGSGPFYQSSVKSIQDTCKQYWWSFFFYLQNYVNYNDVCIAHTWYLSADWQLFILSPIILIPVAIMVKRKFRCVMGTLVIANILFTILPVVFKFLYHDYNNPYETHGRLNVYFIGLTLGVFLREKKNIKYRFDRITNLFIWVIALFVMILAATMFKEIQLLARYDLSYTTYFIFLRTLWSIGLCWIIYSCHSGYGGPINWFLTIPPFQILGRLTYCIYLVHAIPISYDAFSSKQLRYHELHIEFNNAIAHYCVAVFFSFFWSLAFESPFIVIEKYLMSKKSK